MAEEEAAMAVAEQEATMGRGEQVAIEEVHLVEAEWAEENVAASGAVGVA